MLKQMVHQDEFLRGDHPETMFRGSIIASFEAAIINAKYKQHRFDRLRSGNGLNLVQTDAMSN